MGTVPTKYPVRLSIGIMAWNEEDSIRTTLESLFRQSVFQRLCSHSEQCEIVVVANGCSDRTVPVTRAFLEQMAQEHEWRDGFTARVVDVPEPGKCNAWNRFVHEFSSLQAEYICCMDADIVFHHRDTIFNLMDALERQPGVVASSGRQCKDILFKERKTLRDRISLATSSMSATSPGQICGQLYCVRAATARNIYLPRGLGAVEDGFIKAAVCTDFFTRDDDLRRVAPAPNAAHIFEAYVSLRDVLNNQKRQMIGQATVHVLVSYLRSLPLDERRALADTLRRLDQTDPDWLKQRVNDYIRSRRFFWQLFPGALGFRFRRLWKLPPVQRLTHLPAALAGFGVTFLSAWRANRVMRAGVTQYWPKAARQTILTVPQVGAK